MEKVGSQLIIINFLTFNYVRLPKTFSWIAYKNKQMLCVNTFLKWTFKYQDVAAGLKMMGKPVKLETWK